MRADSADGNQAPGAAAYREEFLYDLLADPHELTNLADKPEHRGRIGELRSRLAAWQARTGDTTTLG